MIENESIFSIFILVMKTKQATN